MSEEKNCKNGECLLKFEVLEKEVDNLKSDLKETMKRVGKLEKVSEKRDEQFVNLSKALSEINQYQKESRSLIESVQKEIKEQQNGMIVQMMEKQDSLIKLFVEKDSEERKAERNDDSEDKKRIFESQKQRDKNTWDLLTKIFLGLLSLATMAYTFLTK